MYHHREVMWAVSIKNIPPSENQLELRSLNFSFVYIIYRYFDWLSTAWAYPKWEKENGPWKARSYCNIGHLTPKFMFNMNLVKSRPYITSISVVESLCKFGHGSNTAVIWAFKNESTTQQQVMDRWNFARFEFNMIFGGIPYIAPNVSYH